MIRIKKGWGSEFRYYGRLTRRQERKFDALVKDGLSTKVAHEFIFFDFKNAYMRRFRAAIRRGVTGNPWELFRKFYDAAIAKGKQGKRGGYKPPKRVYDPSKPHKKLDAEGKPDVEHIRKQAKEYREKPKLPKGAVSAQYGTTGELIGTLKQDPITGKFYTDKG